MSNTTSQAVAKHIEMWPIARLIPWAKNPRTHSEAQIAQIAASIAEFGFNNPILVDTRDGIIAGHGSTGFSADGREVWIRGGASPANVVRMMPLLGGPLRPFLQAVVVSYTVDGTRMVFHRADGDPIFVSDANGANPKQIFRDPNPGAHCHFPIWSRDGKWIYFTRGNPSIGDWDLWRISPSGGEPERMTERHSLITYPAVLDDHTLLYVSLAEDGSGPWLYSFDIDRRVSKRESVGLEQYLSVATSNDGRRAVAAVANPSASLWSLPIQDHPAEESQVIRVPLSTVRALSPRLANGGAIFYLSSLGGGDGLWRYKDGDALEIWKGKDGPLFEPAAVSPDGKRLAITLRKQGRIHLNVLNDDGTGLTAIAESLDVRGSAGWSPDGQWLAVGGIGPKGQGVFKVPAAGGEPTQISTTLGTNPVWSPDGGVIVFGGPATGRFLPLIAIQPDGTPVKLPDLRVRFDGQRYRFLPREARKLVYMTGQQRKLDFALLDMNQMQPRPLTHLDNPALIEAFDVTPDGKRIIFDRLRENSDIVLIDFAKTTPQ